MTKDELLAEFERLANACRSFQGAYALYDGDDMPPQLQDVWEHSENIIQWDDGAWKR